MKRILVFLNSMSPAGGIERVVANLTNSWSEKYEITILVKDKEKSFYMLNENIKIESLNLPLILDMNNRIQRIYSVGCSILKTRKYLKEYLNTYNYDYIYVTTPMNALEVFLTGKKNFDKLVISEHGSKLAYNKLYKLIKYLIYPRAYRISVPTTMDTELYIKEGCNAKYIPHISTFQAKSKNELNKKTIINIGRLTEDKQQLTLLRIWRSLVINNETNGWCLKIIGKGEMESDLRDYIYKNKLSSSVEILSPTKDIEKVYKDASVFAFTSRYEGFGMVLLEAMSFGIPCISFNCPSGPRDIINNDVNGYLIECNNVDEYKEKLIKLINEDSTRTKMGNNAFNTVKEWNNNKILQEWDELFGRN